MADTVPIAELYAVLGLDASQLDEGLAATRVKLQDILPPIVTVDEALKRLGIDSKRSLYAGHGPAGGCPAVV